MREVGKSLVAIVIGKRGSHSLVGTDTGGFESLGAQLFVLIGNEVNTEGEVVDTGTLSAKIEDPDLGVGDTTVEAGLGIRLEEKTGLASTIIIDAKQISRVSGQRSQSLWDGMQTLCGRPKSPQKKK